MAHNIGPIMADHDREAEYALVECIGDDFTCKAQERVKNSTSLRDFQITEILAERGWSVGPTLRPQHSAAPEDKNDKELQ